MYRSFIVNRVYRKNFSSCCCKMCNSEIPLNVNTIIYHLESTEIHRQHFHKIQLDQELERLPEDLSYYLFDNGITYNGNSKYICHSCNSSIFGINTVRRHIGGYLHSKILDSKKFREIHKVHLNRPLPEETTDLESDNNHSTKPKSSNLNDDKS